MTRYVSAADANRQFSEILGQAAGGETVVITRRGEPVAQLTPFDGRTELGVRAAAWSRLLSTLDEGLPLGGGDFDRDALYDR
jgi:prevent-host-death family protein